MTTTSSCLDAAGCGGPFSESGGGGSGGDGGDGVGKWSGVIGLGEVWLSGGLLGRGCEFMSSTISPSVGAVAGRSAWGTDTIGAIIEDRRAITLTSLSGFLSKFDMMVAVIMDCASCPGWCPPNMKLGAFVEIF